MPLSYYYHRMMQSWRFHSRLEQILIGVTTITTFLFLLFLILLIHQHKSLKENPCTTPACLIEAVRIVERVDPTINPCEDFYKFACGNYMKNGNEEPFENLFKAVEYDINQLYFQPIKEGEHYMVKSEKKLFQTCLKTAAIRADNLTTIKEGLKELGGWPIVEGTHWDESKFDWLETTYKLRELGYPFEAFLELSVTVDPRNISKVILKVSLPFYGFVKGETRKEEMMNDALLFGADSKFASKDVDEMYDLEQKLKKVPHGPGEAFTVDEIQKKITNVNWLELLNKLSGPGGQISINDVVTFPPPENLRKHLDIISSASKRAQANFLIWKVIKLVKPHITVKYVSKKSLIDYCLTLVKNKYVPSPMFVMYLRNLLPKSKKTAVEELILNTRSALTELLNKIDWLENSQRLKIKDKIEHTTVMIEKHGDYLNDKVLDDMNVDMRNISRENFLNLLLQAERNHKSQIYSQIHKVKEEIPLHHRGWFKTPNILAYFSKNNLLYISAFVLQNKTFKENRPQYLNYGIFGTEIGKQLSDMFHEMPRKVDKSGGKINETQTRLEKLEECLIQDMEDNGMTIEKNTMVFALPTYLIGPKLSYDAYTKWRKSNGEEIKLVGVDYTPNQLFWISSITCEAENSFDYGWSFLVQAFPDHYSHMVNTSLRHQPDFARDFNCPRGSPINPTKRCDMF